MAMKASTFLFERPYTTCGGHFFVPTFSSFLPPYSSCIFCSYVQPWSQGQNFVWPSLGAKKRLTTHFPQIFHFFVGNTYSCSSRYCHNINTTKEDTYTAHKGNFCLHGVKWFSAVIKIFLEYIEWLTAYHIFHYTTFISIYSDDFLLYEYAKIMQIRSVHPSSWQDFFCKKCM